MVLGLREWEYKIYGIFNIKSMLPKIKAGEEKFEVK